MTGVYRGQTEPPASDRGYQPGTTSVHIGPDEWDAIGTTDVETVTEWAERILRLLAELRGGTADLDSIAAAVRILDGDMTPRLRDLIAAAVREHVRLGGTHAALAEAMGVPRQTAVSRVRAATTEPHGDWSEWATQWPPTHGSRTYTYRIGYTVEVGDLALTGHWVTSHPYRLTIERHTRELTRIVDREIVARHLQRTDGARITITSLTRADRPDDLRSSATIS